MFGQFTIYPMFGKKSFRKKIRACKTNRIAVGSNRAVTDEGDIVLDPAAGGWSVFSSCELTNRNFIGCDLINGDCSLRHSVY